MKKIYWIVLVLVLLSYGLTAYFTLNSSQGWGDDFASYIMQARSIVDGTEKSFFEHNSLTIYNSSEDIGPVAYPWGYPLLLAPVYRIFGLDLFALKLTNIFFFLLFSSSSSSPTAKRCSDPP